MAPSGATLISMAVKIVLTDNIDRIIDKNSPAYLTLLGFRNLCQRFFKIKDLPLIQSQDVKREIRQGVDAQNVNMQKYPYAYFSLTNLSLTKDQQSLKNIGRNSNGYTLEEIANAMVRKAFMFPASIGVELHYITNDLVDAVDFSTRTLILATTGKLNFKITHEGTEWTVLVVPQSEDVSFSRTDKDNEPDPEGMDLVIAFSLQTRLGSMRDVPKVNNDGIVTTALDVARSQNAR